MVRGRYLAVYDMETPDIDKAAEMRREKLKGEIAQGRASDLIEVVCCSIFWRCITECGVDR